MSFLESAISSWRNLIRCILFIAFISGCIYFLVQQIAQNVFPVVQDVSLEGDVLKFCFRGKSLSVVNIPACQIWAPSGEKLSKNSSITIVASGLISTGAFPDISSSGEQDEVKKRLLQIEIDRDIHQGWRGPDGQLVTSIGSGSRHIQEDDCIAKKSNELKLDKEAEYGYLLGFVVPSDTKREDVDNLLINRKLNIFRIGKRSVITFNKSKDVFVVNTLGEKELQLPSSFENGEVFVAINDTVISSEDDLRIPEQCNMVDPFTLHIRELNIDAYRKLNKPNNLWFLNNRGSFVVNLFKG